VPFVTEPASSAGPDRPPGLIVGLGNPGERYANTRHNAGFMVIDALAREGPAGDWRIECQSLLCPLDIEGHPVLLVKPLTYMNLSGHAVGLLLADRGFAAKDVLLVLDDLSLPFGKIRVRPKGSAGGHHGLESVLRILGTEEVARIRLGIGAENVPEDRAEWVLSAFPSDCRPDLDEMIRRAVSAVKIVMCDGVDRARAMFNGR
jgi:PTH1 family peptidyl-tRNA hydrolase